MSRSATAQRRLFAEYSDLLDTPIEGVLAHPSDENIFLWFFAIAGPLNTPFTGGLYYGELVFTDSYPITSPSIYFITPNGRFECNTDLCLGFPQEANPSLLWSPANTVSSILVELWLAFTEKKDSLSSAFIKSNQWLISEDKQQELAEKSWEYNLKDKTFCKYFPQLMEVIEEEVGNDENGNVIINIPEQLPVSDPIKDYSENYEESNAI